MTKKLYIFITIIKSRYIYQSWNIAEDDIPYVHSLKKKMYSMSHITFDCAWYKI